MFSTLDVSVDPGGQIYLRFTPAVAGPAGCLALCDDFLPFFHFCLYERERVHSRRMNHSNGSMILLGAQTISETIFAFSWSV